MKAQILYSIFFAIHLNIYCQNSDSIPLPKTVKAIYTNTPLRDSPDPFTDISHKVPKDSELEVIGFFETYLRVKIDSLEGFVSYTLVKSYSKEFRDFVSRAKKIELENQRKETEEKKSARFIALKTKYGEWATNRILQKTIWIGMTEEMLIDSWGNPQDINSTVTRYGSRKQYVYGGGQYVYVVNGKVDAWQN
jgi:hypothetical protein